MKKDEIRGESLTIFRVASPSILAPDEYSRASLGLVFPFLVGPCHRRD